MVSALAAYDRGVSADLVVKNLAGGHAHRTLFEGLDFTVAPGDVVGVVGANGAGKTTLLRILAGDLAPLEGSVSTAPTDAFVGWLPQEHERMPGETVGEYVARRTGAADATASMEAAAAALGADEVTRASEDAFAKALDHWQASGAADLDERLPPVLADLGLTVGADALMTSLSGGQAARAALAALLLSRFDVVLLDEPTNDLDLAGLERLEHFVRGLRSGVVLVSHDREFLSRVVTRVVELDLAQHQVAVYDGGYDAFLAERAVARRHAREAYEEFADKKADLVARARTQREWSSQGVRNAIKKAPDNDKIRRRASLGASVAVGEIDQSRTALAEDRPLGDAFEAAMPQMTPADVRTLLAKFGLKADQVSSLVGSLSPGERTRAAMALLHARGVNLLVLDEPTNHLDLPAIEQLEQALDSYDGSLLLVSHDRRMLDTVRLDQRWHVEDGQVTISPGG